MKVFLFDCTTGLYAGEDFQSDHDPGDADGVTLVPPPPWQPGDVPVFDRAAGCWRLVPRAALQANGGGHA